MACERCVEMILDRMLEIWDGEERWTQEQMASTNLGTNVNPRSPQAVRWCLIGCLDRAVWDLGLTLHVGAYHEAEVERLLNHYAHQEFSRSAVSFNDASGTTFEDVRLFVKCLKEKPWPPVEEQEV